MNPKTIYDNIMRLPTCKIGSQTFSYVKLEDVIAILDNELANDQKQLDQLKERINAFFSG